MAVNGVEIKVGQIWETYGREIVKVTHIDDHADYPVNLHGPGNSFRCVGTNGRDYGDLGYTDEHATDHDLKRLIADDAANYTLWSGGSNPVPGVRVAVILRSGETETMQSEGFDWGHADSPFDIIAYKVLKEAAKPTAVLDAQEAAAPTSALDVQEGGSHYKSLAIQPVEYIQRNNLDYFQGNVIKYITRHKSKNGAEDVRKALHYCQLVLELQYGEKAQ